MERIPRALYFSVARTPFSTSEPHARNSRLLRGVFYGRFWSRTLAALAAVLALRLEAKDQPAYQKGVLIEMQSSSCGYAEKDGRTLAGEIVGTDGQHKNTKQVLCQEYTLQTERLNHRIRPKDDRHPMLLPIGETAEFCIRKDRLLLRVRESHDKVREYVVVAMPRERTCDRASPHRRTVR